MVRRGTEVRRGSRSAAIYRVRDRRRNVTDEAKKNSDDSRILIVSIPVSKGKGYGRVGEVTHTHTHTNRIKPVPDGHA